MYILKALETKLAEFCKSVDPDEVAHDEPIMISVI